MYLGSLVDPVVGDVAYIACHKAIEISRIDTSVIMNVRTGRNAAREDFPVRSSGTESAYDVLPGLLVTKDRYEAPFPAFAVTHIYKVVKSVFGEHPGVKTYA